MPMKEYNPTTPSRRGMNSIDYSGLTKKKPEKSLLGKETRSGGRNNMGRITMRHIGGGHKRRYRIIDFRRDKFDIPAKVAAIEYDPNRSAFLALLHFADGEKRYIIAPQGLAVGRAVIASQDADILPGNALPISHIPVGTNIYNIELKPGKGGQIARSAGTYAQLMAKEGKWALLKLPSGEVRRILTECMASIGEASNPEHENLMVGKAGRTRWMGVKPTVRGMVMNPVDHPHGGGEGRSKGGNHPCSPWGTPAKGYKTRQNKRTQSMIVKDRRSKL